ncbi:hypothetical protein VDGD_09357 [Verticillium dahliae]|nr:hypothetical protein VDGD_09357 [Verticillium dahliae]
MATHQPHAGGAPSAHGHPGPSPTDEGSPNPPESSKESTTSAYRRASRKGAVKKFSCSFPGCDKLYSRAEHLHRHQLNHAPKEIFRCEEPGCDQKFVRADLLARHKKRHFTSSYIPRNRTFSFKSSHPELAATSSAPAPNTTSTAGAAPRTQFPSHPSSGPHDAAILLTPDSEPAPRLVQPSSWPPPQQPTMHGLDMNMGSKTAYYGREAVTMAAESSTMLPFDNGFQADGHLSENFAMWLFDAQAGWNELNAVANMPFLEGGLESTFNNNINYDYESLTSRSQPDPTPPRQENDDLLTEHRREEILSWFRLFRSKQPKYEASITRIVQESGGDVPGLSLDMMRHCLHTYWVDVSPRLPIVHQPTFSCNRCPIFLVMVMLALGAASLRARDTTSTYVEYGGFADVIISSVRWEIVTAEDANPPVALWVAQALLLLEYYETLFSFRKFHERAHIYHSATLTLLRRGSPLIGKAGSESPPEEAPPSGENDGSSDSRTWWVRWAETQSMHRVVFGAFMMDIIHATMFGHLADMAPDEIRLPLPCDDSLWAAPNPDSFRSVDSTWRMYGIKQISFLEGLKSALHCNPVKTHSFGRMIIMCGLLSVGWHLSHRDSQIKWLDRPTRTSEHDTWRRTILKAFDIWKESYDADIGLSETNLGESHGSANGPVQSPSVLYHFAHIALQVDIVTCQVFAGAKRLVNRKISTRDYSNAVARMRIWSSKASTRHAVLHAFKLLHRVLVGGTRRGSGYPPLQDAWYSCRNEADPHRPWSLYYAALGIWSLVRALNGGQALPPYSGPYLSTATYLTRIANLSELTEETARGLGDGLPDLLRLLQASFEDAHAELLHEAAERLKTCRELMAGAGT